MHRIETILQARGLPGRILRPQALGHHPGSQNDGPLRALPEGTAGPELLGRSHEFQDVGSALIPVRDAVRERDVRVPAVEHGVRREPETERDPFLLQDHQPKEELPQRGTTLHAHRHQHQHPRQLRPHPVRAAPPPPGSRPEPLPLDLYRHTQFHTGHQKTHTPHHHPTQGPV